MCAAHLLVAIEGMQHPSRDLNSSSMIGVKLDCVIMMTAFSLPHFVLCKGGAALQITRKIDRLENRHAARDVVSKCPISNAAICQ